VLPLKAAVSKNLAARRLPHYWLSRELPMTSWIFPADHRRQHHSGEHLCACSVRHRNSLARWSFQASPYHLQTDCVLHLAPDQGGLYDRDLHHHSRSASEESCELYGELPQDCWAQQLLQLARELQAHQCLRTMWWAAGLKKTMRAPAHLLVCDFQDPAGR